MEQFEQKGKYKVQLSNNQLLSNGCINFSSKNNIVALLVQLVIDLLFLFLLLLS